MYLFILESIGTSELILIGIIALIFLGPRKLPQIARTIGKTMADFRNTTNEFKSTWQREVDFEEELKALKTFDSDEPDDPTPVPRSMPDAANSIAPPEIKPASTDLFDNLPDKDSSAADDPGPTESPQESSDSDAALSDKRNWL